MKTYKKILIIILIICSFLALATYSYNQHINNQAKIELLNNQIDSLNYNIRYLNDEILLDKKVYHILKQDIKIIKDSLTILKNKNNETIKKYKKKYAVIYNADDQQLMDFFTNSINNIQFTDSIP